MQIFWPGGILMPGLRPAHTVPAGDNRLIQVRAREVSHLIRLRDRYLPDLGEIIEMPNTDYEYRAYCTHEQLANALAAMAMDIDYVKSKDQAVKQYNDDKLYRVNNAVWGTLYRMLSTHRVFDPPAKKMFTQTRSQVWQHSSSFDDNNLTAAVPAEWDAEVPDVTRFPDGRIDHSYCTDHGQSKAAKRRCTHRNAR